jgi:DNA-binding NarL/FixJ family response regulator
MDGAIRVLLADDHPVVLEGLRIMLSGDAGIEIVGEAAGGEEALQRVEQAAPHVVLMDIRMPGMGGLEATRQLRRKHPTVAVIVLTMYDNDPDGVEAIRSGAAGYLTKDVSRELLCHAVRAVVDGGTLVRSGLRRRGPSGPLPYVRAWANPGEATLLEQLSPRELEVLGLIVEGRRNRAIGEELHLAEVTVKKHVQSIIGKLGASDRTHAAVLGVRSGLVG